MPGRKDDEPRRGQFNPISLEQERICRLSGHTILIGLFKLIEERMTPLMKPFEKMTPQEGLLYELLDAVNSTIDPDDHYENWDKQPEYRQQVATTLDYMRFLGFPEQNLTAEGIAAAEDRLNLMIDPERLERETGIINLTSRRVQETNPKRKNAEEKFQERIKKSQREQKDQETGIDVNRERRSILAGLDIIMLKYKTLPSYEEYSLFIETFTSALEDSISPGTELKYES